MKPSWAIFLATTLAWTCVLADERFPPAAGQPGSTAIAADDCRLVAWADEVVFFQAGFLDAADPESGDVQFGELTNALGPADASPELPIEVVSLGDGGVITLRFRDGIRDEPGPDFAVFENGFVDGFIELAFVEVSSDGLRFTRFPSVSLTPTDRQAEAFGRLDPTLIHNLAGKYRVGFGAPFDLEELRGQEGLDVEQVRFVRLIDVVGSVDPNKGARDSRGNLINDPYPTRLASGGFDLDAIGVFHSAKGGVTEWLRSHFGCESAKPDDDPDGDGWSNLFEYGFGLDPRKSDGQRFGWKDGALLVPKADHLVITVESSADLLAWTSLSIHRPGQRPEISQLGSAEAKEGEGGYWVRPPLSGKAGFLRLRAEPVR